MKTDPTNSITGAAGMPLSYHVIQSERDLAKHAKLGAKSNDSISDTLETSDRDGDGRSEWELKAMSILEAALELEENDGLDVEG